MRHLVAHAEGQGPYRGPEFIPGKLVRGPVKLVGPGWHALARVQLLPAPQKFLCCCFSFLLFLICCGDGSRCRYRRRKPLRICFRCWSTAASAASAASTATNTPCYWGGPCQFPGPAACCGAAWAGPSTAGCPSGSAARPATTTTCGESSPQQFHRGLGRDKQFA